MSKLYAKIRCFNYVNAECHPNSDGAMATQIVRFETTCPLRAPDPGLSSSLDLDMLGSSFWTCDSFCVFIRFQRLLKSVRVLHYCLFAYSEHIGYEPLIVLPQKRQALSFPIKS